MPARQELLNSWQSSANLTSCRVQSPAGMRIKSEQAHDVNPLKDFVCVPYNRFTQAACIYAVM
eukprot:scaffold17242_cov15-Tisochrysis_lutea.AAC.1